MTYRARFTRLCLAGDRIMKKLILIIFTLLLALSFTSCVGIGYSSRGGWFVWPGGCGLLVIILLILFLSRRRR